VLDLGHADEAPPPPLEPELLAEDAKYNMVYTISILTGFADALAGAYIGTFEKRMVKLSPSHSRQKGETWTNLATKVWCSTYLTIYLLKPISGATEMEYGTNDDWRSDERIKVENLA
jgi:hypothetical protein